MKLFHVHYGIWAIMIMVCIIGGMLFRGQQDLIREKSVNDGMTVILKDLSMAELSKVKI